MKGLYKAIVAGSILGVVVCFFSCDSEKELAANFPNDWNRYQTALEARYKSENLEKDSWREHMYIVEDLDWWKQRLSNQLLYPRIEWPLMLLHLTEYGLSYSVVGAVVGIIWWSVNNESREVRKMIDSGQWQV